MTAATQVGTADRRRVFVHGVGAITPLGKTWESSLPRLTMGESAIAIVESFDTSGFPSRAAAQIHSHVQTAGDRRMPLVTAAADEALATSPITSPLERVGVFVGAESGRATPAAILRLAQAAGGGRAFDHRTFGERCATFRADVEPSALSPAAVASKLAGRIGALGPVHTVSLACASSAVAIADAVRALRFGRIDVAVCGGVGADVDPLMMVGFGKLSALSAKGQSRPFDIRRDGFVVGEGAAVIVLSIEPSDIEVTGIGISLDAHHLTAPDPNGAGAERAMRAALADAGNPCPDYVQAHGTSTPKNDEVEAQVIARVSKAGAATPVSSVKGALGHWVAGAGALGFLCAREALLGTMLPTAGLEMIDPKCPVDHVTSARSGRVQTAMVNSFAFGGANCSLVLQATR